MLATDPQEFVGVEPDRYSIYNWGCERSTHDPILWFNGPPNVVIFGIGSCHVLAMGTKGGDRGRASGNLAVR